MVVGTTKVYLYADWVHSLKEKRMVVKSIIDRIRNNFNVSVAEVEDLDNHKNIVIGFACVSNEKRYVEGSIQKVMDFIESNCDAPVMDVVTDITNI